MGQRLETWEEANGASTISKGEKRSMSGGYIWIDEWMDRWMEDIWMDGWMDGWIRLMDEWMD